MHKSHPPIFLAIFAFTLSFHFGMCLTCYVCNSSVDSGCLDGEFQVQISNSAVQPSPCNVRDAQFCIKTTTIYGAIMGTARFCSSKSLGDQCQYVDFPDHDRIYQACVFTCGDEACNASRGCFQDLYACLMFLIIMVPLMGTRLFF